MNAQNIIQEALDVARAQYPKTVFDKLFHLEPSESKLKSACIMYLTNRLMAAEANKIERERYEYEVMSAAKLSVEMYGPGAVSRMEKACRRMKL